MRTSPLFTKYKSKRKASQQRTFRISQLAHGCTEKYYLCQKYRLKKHNPITSYDQSTSAECQNQWNFKIVKIYNVQPTTNLKKNFTWPSPTSVVSTGISIENFALIFFFQKKYSKVDTTLMTKKPDKWCDMWTYMLILLLDALEQKAPERL